MRGKSHSSKPWTQRQATFVSIPEKKKGRWGAGLTAAKMAEYRWLKPVLVGQFEFVEWTEDAHLRHSRFMGLRDDKKAKDVTRDNAS
jgi:ATP-dependent DNA ligase